MKSLLDPSFRYTSAAETNLRRTFARIRREQSKAREKRQREAAVDTQRVIEIFNQRREQKA